jgi:acylphosphatase
MNERIEAIVSGKVQGVWFRQSTKKEAERHGVVGEVKNLPDGTVFVIAEGSRSQLGLLLAFIHQGPDMAEVESVTVTWHSAQGTHNSFEAEHD